MKAGMKMMTMNGKMNSLEELFERQISFQQHLGKCDGEPKDDIENYKYHLIAMQEEMGEVLASDKRWKTHRNEAYDELNKKEELADVLITFMNLCIFSGFDIETLLEVTSDKIDSNFKRLNKC
jgi:NTP pyrophosphatase (non-canonical NTP hydrolase)